tara:strand:- start:6451 stop:6984 length:534 start_codon:yes stop_codon:yes gene_type:complete
MKQENTAGAASTAPNLQNGIYTVTGKTQGHFTLKVYTVKKGDLAGKRIVALLVGPDNTSDYKGVAFWNDERQVAHVWRRHRGPDSHMPIDGYHWQKKGWSSVEQKLAIWSDLAIRGDGTGEPVEFEHGGDAKRPPSGYWAGEGYTLLREGRCVVCNRRLTDPTSIELGIGPKCGGRA